MVWLVYHNTTGKILMGSSDEQGAISNCPEDYIVTEFPNDEMSVLDSKKVQDGILVDDYELMVELGSEDVRFERNQLLKEMDELVSNPLRWASLSSEKQAEWSQYREDLLNVPQQSGFPLNVTWPVKPD